MKRIVLATTIALAFISASGQEQQDSLKSVSMMQELQEVVVKGNLPNTRLKGNAMITRIQRRHPRCWERVHLLYISMVD